MNKIFNHSKLIIVIIFILTAFFAYQLPDLKINNEVDIFLPNDHPSRVANRRMEDIYGGSETMVIAIDAKKSTILDKDNIKLISELTDKLENIKNVNDVKSLSNADYIDGTAEGLEVAPLAKEIPKNSQEISEIKRKLISWDIYKGNLYTNDFKASQIMIKLKAGVDIKAKEDVYFKIKDILKGYKQDDLKFYIAGSPAVTVLLGENMQSDLKRLIPFVILVVLISLYLSFRNLGGVVLPIMTVLISTVWALGIMAIFGINLTMVSTVIPVLLIAVGSAYGIHIISHYYDEIRSSKGELSPQENKEIVLEVVTKVGKPVALAGITTIVGFGSLATSRIMPIKYFGIFTAIGVATALIVAITLIPAILIVRNKELKYQDKDDKQEGLLNRILMGLYQYFSKRRIRVLAFTLVIIILSIIGMSKVVTDSILVEMFKKKTEIRQADKFANDNLNGTNILNVLIEGNQRGALTDPDILKKMDQLGIYLKDNFTAVGKVTSFADFVKRMNKVMHYPAETSSQKKKTTYKQDSSFEENTSSFSQETTSSFGENSDSFSEETTSNFGEDTSNSSVKQNSAEVKIKGPSTEKLSEKELALLFNQALLKAKELNLTAEEFVELINKKLNYQGEAYNEIPYDLDKYNKSSKEQLSQLINGYLLMYSGSLDDLINYQLDPSKARMMVQIKTASNITTKTIEEGVDQYVEKNFPKGYEVTVAGTADMSLAVNNLIVSSQIRSIIVSLLIVFIIVALSYRSFVAGIFGIIPLAISLLVNFGLMGFLGIKLDIGTAMVASIAIGIGVDYTIHFLSTYEDERRETDDLEVVTKNTLFTSGKAIVFNAVSVATGFAVLLFSNFNPLVNLGLLVSITMFSSSVASMTVLPILLNLIKPKFISKNSRVEDNEASATLN
ncbi:hypothetical protein BX659_1193 [Orenia metallireducens]|uniref:SSD domain-containing protein n=1 Tax=Orenia metallireducens TaxID=1413210 RepID=A0A285HM66_9FIRM|nr:MMPL family transporter [Orenia metallireducens]PRX26639.1 hypothetical protein BX659_1193 [Orenia metallireducens]SNY35771.1 hypothetical protein SAMN06265827_1203 [Orenia metallireducens]